MRFVQNLKINLAGRDLYRVSIANYDFLGEQRLIGCSSSRSLFPCMRLLVDQVICAGVTMNGLKGVWGVSDVCAV